MKNTIKMACLLGAMALASQGAMASGLKVRGGVTNNAYSLDITPATGAGYNYATSSYSGNNLGLTLLMDDKDTAYLDVAIASGSGTWDGKYGFHSSGAAFTSNMSRSDSAIVVGTNLITGGSVTNLYAGWKSGETKLDRAPGAATNPSLNFKTSGFIFGGGVGFSLGGAGALGLSLGMGIMGGQYDSTSLGVTTANKADMALGYSYGIGYTYSFTKNFGISADYKGNGYSYTYDQGLTTEWKLDEKFNTTGVSLFVKF